MSQSVPRTTTATVRRAVCVLALVLAASPAWADTVLHLSQTATVTEPPNELDATLRAQVTSTNTADAQKRVNTMIADALARARQVKGITVSTGGYTVWRVGPTQQDHTERWQAGQNLQLKGTDGTTLLKLAGELQQKGLATQQLEWRLSPQAERKAHAEATRQAISQLRGRIDEAAELLGLRFGSFKDVQLDVPKTPVFPRLMGAAAMAAPSAAPPPSAISEDIAVSATVQADAILLPR